MSLYDLTLEEYAAILAAQGGVCFGCGRPPKAGAVLHVDHDHRADGNTSVRGLLCVYDNTRLAAWESPTPEWAGRYLSDPPARAVLAAMRGEGNPSVSDD